MALSPMGSLASEVYQQLKPLAARDEEFGYPLANYLAALLAPAQLIEDLARDTVNGGPGYSILVDTDLCPAVALPWHAQFKGVVLPDGLTEAEQREWIHSAEGQYRGMIPALVKAGQRHLTGAKTVRVVERAGPSVYDLIVITRTAETPDPTTTLADFRSAKRIGIRLQHVVSDAPIIEEWTDTIDSVTATIDAMTVADVT